MDKEMLLLAAKALPEEILIKQINTLSAKLMEKFSIEVETELQTTCILYLSKHTIRRKGLGALLKELDDMEAIKNRINGN